MDLSLVALVPVPIPVFAIKVRTKVLGRGAVTVLLPTTAVNLGCTLWLSVARARNHIAPVA